MIRWQRLVSIVIGFSVITSATCLHRPAKYNHHALQSIVVTITQSGLSSANILSKSSEPYNASSGFAFRRYLADTSRRPGFLSQIPNSFTLSLKSPYLPVKNRPKQRCRFLRTHDHICFHSLVSCLVVAFCGFKMSKFLFYRPYPRRQPSKNARPHLPLANQRPLTYPKPQHGPTHRPTDCPIPTPILHRRRRPVVRQSRRIARFRRRP